MKVYKVVTIQYFDYESLVFKKKNRVIKEVFLMRNLKFIYASNNEEAIEKYNKNFRKDYGNSITGWGDWFYYSDEVSIELIDRVKKINKVEVKAIDVACGFTYEDYKRDMTAEDFKNWWFDNGRCNVLPN